MYLKPLLILFIVKISVQMDREMFQDPQYRLPLDSIEALHYTIEITITNETLYGKHQFEGNVTIVFKNTNTTSEIKLYFGRDMILGKTLLKVEGKDVEINKRNINDLTEILTLLPEKEIEENVTCELRIEYNADFYNNTFYGFYQSTYLDEEGSEKILGTTKFEPYYAHTVFPCFDEPQYKATFNLTVKHPEEFTVVSNTKKVEVFDLYDPSLQTSKFSTTPKMSTYLLAFIIHNFTCTERIEEEILFSVCSRPGTEPRRELVLDFSPKVIKFLEDFTELGYNSVSGIYKIDQFAIPQTDSGAMENWGLVTYSELYLLWDPENSSNNQKQQVLKAVAHELAHFWFGNLVTMDWWSNLFLVEGLVTYLGYFIANEIDSSLELDKQFVVHEVQTMLYQDSFRNTVPLDSPVPTPQIILEKFGPISYAKGAVIFRMVHHVVGDDTFRKGLCQYLDKNQFGVASPDDLWSEFQEYDNLAVLIENWVSKPGYPVVTVYVDGLNVTLTQERFISEADTETNEIDFWYIPISFTTSSDSDKFNDTRAEFWMAPEKYFELDLNEAFDWIIFNNQQTGFYRVNYDGHLWKKIEVALKKPDFDGIHELNRAQIVDDFHAFTSTGLKNVSEFLDLLEFLKNDTSYYSWYPAFKAFEEMLDTTATTELRSTFLKYIRDLMASIYKTVPFKEPKNDDQIYSLKREMVVTRGCEFGFQDCIDNSVQAFETSKKTKTQPDKHLRETIFCYGLRHSKDLKNDWNLMWEEMRKSKFDFDRNMIIRVLGCPKNKEVLRSYLHKVFDPESKIPKVDQVSAVSTIFKNKPEGFEVVLDFIIDNHDLEDLPTFLHGFYSRFTTRSQINKFEHFLNTTQIDYISKMVLNGGLANGKYTLDKIESFEQVLKIYFDAKYEKGSEASTLTTGLAIMVTILVFSYKFLL